MYSPNAASRWCTYNKYMNTSDDVLKTRKHII